MNISKILNIATLVMLVITVVILGLFMFGGELPNAQYKTPVHTQDLLVWAYILLGISTLAAIVFPIARLFTRPKEAMKSFIGIIVIALLILLAYTLSDGTIMNLPGYTGTDNIPSRLMFADTILFTMYFLGIGAILAIIVTEVIRRVR